ncbi:hypothetical protein C8R43DRAFT_942707 [Mycena crocata]|nr:hypothetical protein C8R43DRAFT_942707 [Mycena crocata]
MLQESILLTPWNTKDIFAQMKDSSRFNRVWWNPDRAPFPSVDKEQFPIGHVFGQVVGESTGEANGTCWELAKPCFQKRTRGSVLITDAFERQLELMWAVRNASDKAMLAAVVREDTVSGITLKVGGVDYPPGLALGRVVIVRVDVVAGEAAEPNKLVAGEFLVGIRKEESRLPFPASTLLKGANPIWDDTLRVCKAPLRALASKPPKTTYSHCKTMWGSMPYNQKLSTAGTSGTTLRQAEATSAFLAALRNSSGVGREIRWRVDKCLPSSCTYHLDARTTRGAGRTKSWPTQEYFVCFNVSSALPRYVQTFNCNSAAGKTRPGG